MECPSCEQLMTFWDQQSGKDIYVCKNAFCTDRGILRMNVN